MNNRLDSLDPNDRPHRQLLLTPFVKFFLEKCGQTESAQRLSEDIGRALSGQSPKDGFTLASAPTFLLRIVDAEFPGGPERIVVWHGPSEGGLFFKEAILACASPYGIELT